MARFFPILSFLTLSLMAFAQSESKDSLSVRDAEHPGGAVHSLQDSLELIPPTGYQERLSKPIYHSLDNLDLSVPELKVPEIDLGLDYNPYVARWRNGGILGNVSSQSLPGMMGVESGGLALVQDFGRFSIAAYGEALKYGYYGGLSRSFGFGGSLTYRANEKLSFTLFGSYYTSPGFATPGMAGYMEIPNFGGYMNYMFNDRWGVKVGAQSYRSMAGNHWDTQPILIPYYKFSKDVELGIDVGGILYQVLDSKRNKKTGHYWNPTMGPPSAPALSVGPAMPPPPHD